MLNGRALYLGRWDKPETQHRCHQVKHHPGRGIRADYRPDPDPSTTNRPCFPTPA